MIIITNCLYNYNDSVKINSFFPKHIKKLHKVLRERSIKFHILSGSRMRDPQDLRMQRLALKLIRTPGRIVYRISQDRMSDGRHVDADLMRPPGLQFALNIRIIPPNRSRTL